jgi:acyl-CoA reductase-like NAD-dependent aldehyde dehydrogenase
MIFTENLSRAHRVAAQLRAGTIWANCFFIRDLRAPFGGFGESGGAAKVATSAGSSSPSPRPW